MGEAILQVGQVVGALRYKDPNKPAAEEVGRRKRFISRYPTQEANLLSYQENPSCKCAGEMAAMISKDPEGASAAASFIMDQPVTVVTPKNVAGTLTTIENTPEAYRELISGMAQRAEQHRGLSAVLLPDGKLQILFW
jgi:hypothetical protein